MKKYDETTHKVKYRPLIFISCLFFMFMVAVEATIVSTAMPYIAKNLGGFSLVGWVFSIYLLPQAITIPIYGRFADLYGCRIVLFFGTTIFLTGSFLCGMAHSLTWLIIFRGFQGVGAGSITPIITTLTYHLYNEDKRAKIQGYLSSVWGGAAVAGPIIGAYIISSFHWSMVFWINIPIGFFSLGILMAYLPQDISYHKHRIDYAGLFFLCLAICSLMLLLSPYSFKNFTACAIIICFMVSILCLIYCESVAPEPLFPVELWRNRLIILSNVGSLSIGAGMMGISAYLPTYVQVVFDSNTFQAGIALSMMSIGWPLASIFSGKLLSITSYRFLILTGSLLLIFGNFCLAFLMPFTGIYMSYVGSFMVGVGMGFLNTTLIVAIQNSMRKEIQGISTASLLFSRMLGSGLGTALFSALLNFTLSRKTPYFKDPIQILLNGKLHNTFKQFQLDFLIQTVAQSLTYIFILAICFSSIPFIIGLFFHVEKTEQPQ
ncbi:MDR family MFS transporter [Salmonella enterica]|nr:MDR family MFS transporter [Salmonella enterica]